MTTKLRNLERSTKIFITMIIIIFIVILIFIASIFFLNYKKYQDICQEKNINDLQICSEKIVTNEDLLIVENYTDDSKDENFIIEPIMEEPVIEEPVIEEPVIEEPVIEEPVIEEPVIEEPVIEEPVIEEPVIEEPVIEEPVIEEPVIEEPVIEEPVIEMCNSSYEKAYEEAMNKFMNSDNFQKFEIDKNNCIHYYDKNGNEI